MSKKKNSRVVGGVKFDINSFMLDKVFNAVKSEKAVKKNKQPFTKKFKK